MQAWEWQRAEVERVLSAAQTASTPDSILTPGSPLPPPSQQHTPPVPVTQGAATSPSTLLNSQQPRHQPAPSFDSLFLLQHPPVYTLGAGSSPEHLLFDPQASLIPLHRTERGGEVTYHGPGQVCWAHKGGLEVVRNWPVSFSAWSLRLCLCVLFV